jgi:hypothetical protein
MAKKAMDKIRHLARRPTSIQKSCIWLSDGTRYRRVPE